MEVADIVTYNSKKLITTIKNFYDAKSWCRTKKSSLAELKIKVFEKKNFRHNSSFDNFSIVRFDPPILLFYNSQIALIIG